MALSQKHRVALFERFLPSLGDELTEAFLAEFPLHEGDELVTRRYFEAAMATLRAELLERMADLRAELRTEMAEGTLTQSFVAVSNALGRRGGEAFGQSAEEEEPA